MALTPGTRLGSYEITALVGEGGMGQVYRARDTELDRDVALKILPEEFTRDPDRLARFQREAKALAALNHPNIAQIHGLQRADGHQALIMEFVDGEDLAERLTRGPIPLDDALPIARQIAEALETAHEQGIVHRDLKPANIKVRADGTVKVLDFGLAKALQDPKTSRPQDLINSPTITSPVGTMPGVILGTAAYMSPEQARGKPVDKRTDVWAFGCVLFEMLTGRRAFAAEDVSLTLAEVMKSDPDWSVLPHDTPSRVTTVIRRCLVKDPRQRVRDIGDASLALEGAFDTAEGDGRSSSGPGTAHAWWWRPPAVAIGVIASFCLGGFAAWSAMPGSVEARPVVRFPVGLPADQVLMGLGRHGLAISPDGTALVYVANERLYLRRMDGPEASELRGTQGAREPFFSPDGQQVAFWSTAELRTLIFAGGAPVSLCEAVNPMGATWGWDGYLYYGQPDGIYRVPEGGGVPERIITVNQEAGEAVRQPQRLPGSEWLLFTYRGPGVEWSEADAVVQHLKTDERRTIVAGASDVRYVPSGYVVYMAQASVFAAPFDLARLAVTAPGRPVLDGVFVSRNFGLAQLSVSDTGTLAWVPMNTRTGSIAWLTRAGERQEVVAGDTEAYSTPRISPDGMQAVVSVSGEEGSDLWMLDLSEGGVPPRRFTLGPANDRYPVWTHDGRRVVYQSTRGGGTLVWKTADGVAEEEVLVDSTQFQPSAFSPDDSTLVGRNGATLDLEAVSLVGTRNPQPLFRTPETERNPIISPDGRWLAYESEVSGQPEIYVRPFPVDDRVQPQQVSVGGGSRPLWSPAGDELFWFRYPATVMATAVQTEPILRLGRTVVALQELVYGGATRNFDTRDGERFLVVTQTETGGRDIHIVLNWQEELKRLVPTK